MYECFHCGTKSVVWDCDYDFADFTSEPKTKTGKWVMPNKELTDRPMAECSICGWYVNPKWVDDYDFCPNCGADMRRTKDD